MPGKYNPYRPDKIAPPGIFCGRVEELKAVDHALLQTKNGNSQHFLLEGERGIGKSSIMLCGNLVARGKLKTFDDKHSLDFIVVHITLNEKDDYYSIIRHISDELRKQVAKRSKLKALVLTTWDFISRFEAGGVKFNRDAPSDQTKLLDCLKEDFATVIGNFDESTNGVLLLVDEADKPSTGAHLGLICKLITEDLTNLGLDRLCIGLAGLPNLISVLRGSHESAPRIFKTMGLKPLENGECIQVIDAGLRSAESINKFAVTMTDEAKELISMLSEGYPHFLQEFCYCAFEADEDNVVDRKDVTNSLFAENGAFDQLGRKYFDHYYAAPASDDYRKVLHTMGRHLDDWVSRAAIIKESGLKESTVDNALRALKGKTVILQDETRQGHYRLPTKSFAVWLNARVIAEDAVADEAESPQLFQDRPSG